MKRRSRNINMKSSSYGLVLFFVIIFVINDVTENKILNNKNKNITSLNNSLLLVKSFRADNDSDIDKSLLAGYINYMNANSTKNYTMNYTIDYGTIIDESDDINSDSNQNRTNWYEADYQYSVQANFTTGYNLDVQISNLNQTNLAGGSDNIPILVNQQYCNFKKFLIKHNKTNNNISIENVNYDKNTTSISSIYPQGNITIAINRTGSNNQNNSDNNITNNLLSIITDNTLNIKKEICVHCLDISQYLDVIIEEIKRIKNKITSYKNDKIKSLISSRKLHLKITRLINNVNYIKADLYKLNEILHILKRVKCSNYSENSNKYHMVVNSTQKLVEVLQKLGKNLNLRFDIVILT